ncbi:MAG: hypothetical protein JWR90_1115 [Marmoricola sp.]|jgi:hypothetical protein|nr:hypothetical protein [Marmoricola sp.]
MLELFFQAAWKVLVAGLVLGAGIPALFALGVRFSAAGTGGAAMTVPSSKPNPALKALAAVCFVIAALAVVLGITVVVASGFGKMVSFDHVFPTLVDKG